jgi:hypothetical protein
MQEKLENLFNTLNSVLPSKVSYGTREGLEDDPNYIIYQELSNRSIVYADDKVIAKVVTFQVNLITEKPYILWVMNLNYYLNSSTKMVQSIEYMKSNRRYFK